MAGRCIYFQMDISDLDAVIRNCRRCEHYVPHREIPCPKFSEKA
jgi:uracil-DNA glycosylase